MIKMIIKGRSPTLRQVPRTRRVALDWLFDRINLEPKIQIKFVDTRKLLADILTNGSFSRNEWNHFLCLFNIMSFPTYSGSHSKNFLSQAAERIPIGAMSERGQETTSSDGSPLAKARPTDMVMHSQGVSAQVLTLFASAFAKSKRSTCHVACRTRQRCCSTAPWTHSALVVAP